MGGHHHGHEPGQDHHHPDLGAVNERRLWWAIIANGALTVAQVVGGLLAGSLALLADALHNVSDAAALVIAVIAIRIGRKPADQVKSFGYQRAETIAALVNLVALLLIGVYLVIEAVQRFIAPQDVAGWPVVIIAGVALVVDAITVGLTWSGAKTGMNMRAVFVHNLTDALASIGVIIAGVLILTQGWHWADPVMTLVIAVYVMWHGATSLPSVIHLLMEGTPTHIAVADVIGAMEQQADVTNVHHVHVWQLDERRVAMEAHVVIAPTAAMDDLKHALKSLLHERFAITHSTLEFEHRPCAEHQDHDGHAPQADC